MKQNNKYEALHNISTRAHLLDGISGLLGWDQETYMPKQASPIRARQKELLSELSHRIKTGGEFESALSSLIDIEKDEIVKTDSSDSLTEERKTALHIWRRDFLRLKKLPTPFVQNFTKLTSEALHVWQKAKHENDFLLFRPYLQQIVEELKKKVDYLGYEDHPYDALLDEFEPGCKTAHINELFHEIKSEIVPLVKKHVRKHHVELPSVALTDDELIAICELTLDVIGYDRSRGRLDLSEHPFSSSCHPTDCRITTRVEKHGIYMPILTTLHEAGHAFYEMGLPEEHYGSPLAEAASYGVHESQSRFWETRIGRSLPFWEFFIPKLSAQYPGRFDGLYPADLLAAINQVQPSLIRVDADEVTYPLHVILRFEIEKELIEGSLKVADLPERWNAGMKETIGIEPTHDGEGCLQDIHWAMGGFGYFPTYTLGNVYASELFAAFEKEHSDWQERIRRGDFGFIREWHRKKIHAFGRRYSSRELIERVSGRKISSRHYLNYLKEKYL